VFRFNVTDDNVDTCTLWTNDSTWGARNNATKAEFEAAGWNFTYTYSSDGSFAWNIECNDTSAASAFNASNSTINIDTVLPVVNWINATGYAKGRNLQNWSNTSSIIFYVNTTDNNNQSCLIYYNGTAELNNTGLNTNLSNATFNYVSNVISDSATQMFADGSYGWNVTCNDTAGREASYGSAVTLNVDTTDPVVNWINATGYSKGNDLENWSNTNTITFYINTADNNNDTCTVYTNASGSWAKNVTFDYGQGVMSSSAAQIFADGSYRWNASCNDSAENVGQGSSSLLHVDATKPLFVNVTPNAGNWSANSTQKFVFNVTENNLDGCEIWTNMTGTWLKNYTATKSGLNYSGSNFTVTFADGSYNWSVVCNDSAANANATENRTINIDTVPPTINWANETGYSKGNDLQNWSNSSSIIFYVNATDNSPTNCSVYYNKTGGGWTWNTTFAYASNAMSSSAAQQFADGSYRWNITCNDSGANSVSYGNITLNIDTVSPVINWVNASGYNKGGDPENNWSNSSSIKFYASTTDSNNESCVVYTNASGSWAKNVTFNYVSGVISGSAAQQFADGSYRWNVSCNDSAARVTYHSGTLL
jgi:hypothetical protein